MFDRVADHLRRHVRTAMKPGDRLPGIHDLAKQLNVSQWTLRSAQALLAREGVLEVRHGSGVFVAQAAPCWVGIYSAMDILQPRTSSFHTLFPRALRRYLSAQGIQSDIYIGNNAFEESEQGPSNPRFCADVAAGRLSGIALVNAPETDGWVKWIAALGIPAVGALTPYHVSGKDYQALVRQGIERLHAQGSRRIAMLSWVHDDLGKIMDEVLASLGLEHRPQWVLDRFHPMSPGAGWEEFREIWGARREKPDGLLVTDDVLFGEAALAIQELGIRVPDQLRIVTHANKGAVRRYPFPVTECLYDPERHADNLGGMLLKLLKNQYVSPKGDTACFEFVEADSVFGSKSREAVKGSVR